jgi:hypothetical protein
MAGRVLYSISQGMLDYSFLFTSEKTLSKQVQTSFWRKKPQKSFLIKTKSLFQQEWISIRMFNTSDKEIRSAIQGKQLLVLIEKLHFSRTLACLNGYFDEVWRAVMHKLNTTLSFNSVIS